MTSRSRTGRFALRAIAVAACLWPAAAHAAALDPAWRALTDCPTHPGCPALVLLSEMEVDNIGRNAVIRHHTWIKLFSAEGVQNFSDMAIPELIGGQQVKGLTGRTWLPDGRRLESSLKDVQVKTVFKKGRTRVREKRLSLPGVVPGAILEFEWDSRSPDALSTFYGFFWIVQQTVPVRKAFLKIKSPGDKWGYQQVGLEGHPIHSTRADWGMETYTMEDVPPLEPEPLAPSFETARGRFYFSSMVLPLEGWLNNRVDLSWTREFLKSRQKAQEKAREVAGEGSDRDRLRRLYDFVQAGIREGGAAADAKDGEEASSVDVVLERRSGTAVEKNLLFLAMAGAIGLQGGLLLIDDRDYVLVSSKIPAERPDRETAAAVRIGTQWLHFDPGSRFCPFGMIPADKEFGLATALFLSTPFLTQGETVGLEKPSRSPFADRTFSKAHRSAIRRESTVALSPDGTLDVSTVETASGLAGMDRRAEYGELDEAERRGRFEEWLRGMAPRAIDVAVAFEGFDSMEADPILRYSFRMPAAASGPVDSLILNPGLYSEGRPNPFVAEKRVTPVIFPHTGQEIDRIRFELPAGFRPASLPEPVLIREGPLLYVAQAAEEEGVLTFDRRLDIDTAVWSVKDYPRLHDFYAKVREQDHAAVMVTRGAAAPSGGGNAP